MYSFQVCTYVCSTKAVILLCTLIQSVLYSKCVNIKYPCYLSQCTYICTYIIAELLTLSTT